MLGGRSEFTAHFTSAPFIPGARGQPGGKVLSSYDVVGGPHTFNVVWATTKFANKNRKVLEAFVANIARQDFFRLPIREVFGCPYSKLRIAEKT